MRRTLGDVVQDYRMWKVLQDIGGTQRMWDGFRRCGSGLDGMGVAYRMWEDLEDDIGGP